MMSRTAAPSSDVTTPILRGSAGSGRLRRWSNRPSACEPLLQLIERQLQRAEPLGLEVLADELVFALRVVHADAPAGDDAQAILRLEAQHAQRRPEHHAADLGAGILQREIHVAGVPDLQFDSSPSTQTSMNRSSSSVRIRASARRR